jgi:DNA polymerase III gamma/tau subunit
LLIARVCGAHSDLIAATPDQRPGLEQAAARFTEEDLTRYFQILLETDEDLRRKPDPRVHLEMGLLRLVNAARLAPLEELLAESRAGASSGSGGGKSAPKSATPGASAAPLSSRSLAAGVANSFAAPAPVRLDANISTVAGAISVGGAAAAAAPAMKPAGTTPLPARETKTKTETTGISNEEVAEIKSLLQAQQKFVAELLEHASRWELEGSELRICFPPERNTFAGLMEGRETLEKIRAVSGKVLGRAVRVCARLESGGTKEENSSPPASNGGMSTQELRAQFENDPVVKSMLRRFGGRISEVKRPSEE